MKFATRFVAFIPDSAVPRKLLFWSRKIEIQVCFSQESYTIPFRQEGNFWVSVIYKFPKKMDRALYRYRILMSSSFDDVSVPIPLTVATHQIASFHEGLWLAKPGLLDPDGHLLGYVFKDISQWSAEHACSLPAYWRANLLQEAVKDWHRWFRVNIVDRREALSSCQSMFVLGLVANFWLHVVRASPYEARLLATGILDCLVPIPAAQRSDVPAPSKDLLLTGFDQLLQSTGRTVLQLSLIHI